MAPRGRPRRAATLLVIALQGCAITALVGENPDASRPAADVVALDVVALDVVALDVVAPVDSPAVRDFGPQDVARGGEVPLGNDPDVAPPRPDADFRDRPLASIDVGAPDALAVMTDASAVAETSVSMSLDADDGIDAAVTAPDSGLGAPCRRDLDCLGDLARRFCSLSFQRCAATP